MNTCSICKRAPGLFAELQDCGGDCLECMAAAGDPGAQTALDLISKDRRFMALAQNTRAVVRS